VSQVLGLCRPGPANPNQKPGLNGVSPGTASSLIKGQGPGGPQPQRLALVGQQGEDLGIQLGLGQLPDAIDQDLIGQSG